MDLGRFFVYMKENWKNVLGYEGLYEVSDLGRVRKYKGRLLKISNKNGYSQVSLLKEKISKSFLINNIVADSFLGNEYKAPYVNHIDGNRLNNRLDNLKRSFRRNKYTSKLDVNQIKFINDNRHKYSITYLASLYNVCERTISRIL